MSIILGIESSCDETSAAVCADGKILSNSIATQQIHQKYGGVVPELASRLHQQNIVPVVMDALQVAKIGKNDLTAIAFTQGPGLLGSLLVGTSFAKSLALAKGLPLIAINHMQAHVAAHFIPLEGKTLPKFPFLCLTVSGGHTQIVLVKGHLEMEILGETIDDAAGEAFDKAAKMLGLPYPGGPLIDKYAKQGNPKAFPFPEPEMPGLTFSFSGVKTSFLYFLQKQTKLDPNFIDKNLPDLCASMQHCIVSILLKKLTLAAKQRGVQEIALAGGVAANSGLRDALKAKAEELGWTIHIPLFEHCTDNAAMIAMAAHYKFEKGIFEEQEVSAAARMEWH